jgi:methionyl-tRNA formyltransferase
MEHQHKRIAFFGTPPFTVSFLETLHHHGYTPSLIVTNPDRPAGRGMVQTVPEPKRWGQERAIPVMQPEKLDDAFFDELSKTEWDLFIVVAYGAIIPERIITLPQYGTINVHYSLLPRYRGATPVETALLNGDSMTGVCIQAMRYKLDSGPILAKKEIAIAPTDTTPTLRARLNEEAQLLLPETIQQIFAGTTTPQIQDESQETICKKIRKEDGAVSLSDDPLQLDRKYRAYTPWPGLYFYSEKEGVRIRVKIKKAHLNDGLFVVDQVIPENRKPMTSDEFNRWIAS